MCLTDYPTVFWLSTSIPTLDHYQAKAVGLIMGSRVNTSDDNQNLVRQSLIIMHLLENMIILRM